MELSRRTALQGAGALGLGALFATTFQGAARAARTLDDADLELLRQRWVDLSTGRLEADRSDPDFATVLGELDEDVETWLGLLAPVGSDRAYTDQPFGENDANMWRSFTRTRDIARAWATPGSAYHQDPETLDHAVSTLRTINVLHYNPSTPEYGNWWAWEIGATLALTECMAILFEHIEPEHMDDYCEAIDFYVPDPWYMFPPDSDRYELSTGANRTDLCTSIIMRSVVDADTDRLAHAVAGLSDVWQIVESGDGIYYDGSFIQHSTVPYTGTYGVVLLDGLGKLFALLADTNHDIDDPSQHILLDSVEGSFAPVIYRAQMMDSVRGRAISRQNARSIDDGIAAIEAIANMANAVDVDTAQRWRGRCLHWLETNDIAQPYEETTIPRVATFKALESSGATPIPDQPGPRLFARMDRLIYRGQNWATAIAMCSDRIAWYESGNGENDLGFRTSNGMTYLYLPDDVGHFDDEFWATCDLGAPPGTTVDTTDLPPRTEGQWGGSTPDNEWTGGAALSDIALAGQHLIGPGDTGLQARKSWLCLPDMIIAFGSDISTESGNEVKTVVEHRNLGTEARVLTVDGGTVTDETLLTAPAWAHVQDVAGYVFLDVPDLRASVAERTGAWRHNAVGGSETEHTRVYATLEAVHGEDPDTYAYIVLPGLTAARTRARAANHQVQILANDAQVQAVRTRRVHAANFWAAGRGGDISAGGPASVLLDAAEQGRVSISDPTHEADTLEVTLHWFAYRNLAEPNDAVQLRTDGNDAHLVIDTTDLGGLPVNVELVR